VWKVKLENRDGQIDDIIAIQISCQLMDAVLFRQNPIDFNTFLETSNIINRSN